MFWHLPWQPCFCHNLEGQVRIGILLFPSELHGSQPPYLCTLAPASSLFIPGSFPALPRVSHPCCENLSLHKFNPFHQRTATHRPLICETQERASIDSWGKLRDIWIGNSRGQRTHNMRLQPAQLSRVDFIWLQCLKVVTLIQIRIRDPLLTRIRAVQLICSCFI